MSRNKKDYIHKVIKGILYQVMMINYSGYFIFWKMVEKYELIGSNHYQMKNTNLN